MDIYIIETANTDNIPRQLLLEFRKKEISNIKKLNEHCLAYLMTDRILKEVYKLNDREIIFAGNKPILKSGKKHFSISHSGVYTALAFSDHNCGIDIEKAIPRQFEKIAARIKFECSTLSEFYDNWTKFEAAYKLGKNIESFKTLHLTPGKTLPESASIQEDYVITAVSENRNEIYKVLLLYPRFLF